MANLGKTTTHPFSTMSSEIAELEQQIFTLSQKLVSLRKQTPATPVPDYTFETVTGPVTLSALFAGKDTLFAIHNMGQACRYCTLWADGLNGFLPHLESSFSVVLLSKDSPEVQQRFAHSRGWRYRMASHGGGRYITEQSVSPGDGDTPGLVCYQMHKGTIVRRNAADFGPGDAFCGIWHVLSLAGVTEQDWTPQYTYWQRPSAAKMEDGGQNLL